MTQPEAADWTPEPELTIQVGRQEAPLFAALLLRDGEKFECSTWERKGRVFFKLDPWNPEHTARLKQMALVAARDFLRFNDVDQPDVAKTTKEKR